MNRPIIARILFAAGMAVAPLAFADGGIVKCIGPDGHITLTDTACQSGERRIMLVPGARSEPPAAAPAAPPTLARTAGLVQARLPSGPALRVPLSRLDPPSRSLTRDVMTLKAARQALMLMDSAADSIQHRRVAGLR
jgi:hypothetical protein